MDKVPDVDTPWLDFLFASKKLHPNFSRGRGRKGGLDLVAQLESQLLWDLRNGEDSQCAGLRRKHPWLRRMETARHWSPADAEVEKKFFGNPVRMVQTLMLHTDHWLGGRFVGKVGKLLEGNAVSGRNRELRGPLATLDKHQRHRRYRENVKEVQGRSLREDAIKEAYQNCFIEPAFGLPFQGIWLGDGRMLRFPERIVQFAHSRGIDSSVEDPLDCLRELYQRAIALRESQLQDKITRLQGKLSNAINERKAANKKRDGDIKEATERATAEKNASKEREAQLQANITRLQEELSSAISEREAAIKKRDEDVKAATEESTASKEREAQRKAERDGAFKERDKVIKERDKAIKERDRAYKKREERDEVIKERDKVTEETNTLRKKAKEHKEMTHHLAYRVLMEALPQRGKWDKRSNTQKWHNFWVGALKNAKNKAGPIRDLLDNPPPGKTKGDFYKDIELIGGKRLYSKYSKYIHEFPVDKKSYEMDPETVSDAVVLRILQFLKPDPKNFKPDSKNSKPDPKNSKPDPKNSKPDVKVDWAEENKRFK